MDQNVIDFQARQRPPKPAQMLNVPKVVWISIAAIVLVHLVISFGRGDIQVWAYFLLAYIPGRMDAMLQLAQLPFIKYTSFFTYGLLHADWTHLGVNVLWFLVFATPVARRLTAPKFFLIVAAGSFGGALATLVQYWQSPAFTILVGASASISGLMAAATPIMFGAGSVASRTRDDAAARRAEILPFKQLIQNKQALLFMAMFLVITLATGVSQALDGVALIGQHNIAWEAHLGGFLAGLIMFYLLEATVPQRRKLC